MNRRQFLTAATLSAAAGSVLPRAAAQPSSRRPPNILLIMADDFGYECLACNGAAEYKTPNLDALAASGVRFTAAHSTPLCTPTRVQLMTGKYNFRNYTEFGSLKPGEHTFAHMLQSKGYRTGVMGKWQLAGAVPGTAYKGKGSLPEEAGFDEHCLWQVKDRGSRYWDPSVQVNGKLEEEIKGKYGPDLFAQFGEEFIERHRNRPFLLYYPMALTHDPFVPTPRSPNLPAASERHRADRKWFADMVAYMDHCAGRLLAKIEQTGLSSQTLILFTGDNGTGRGITTMTRNGPYKGGKGGSTAAGTHVPLLARWAGRSPKGAVSNDLIDFTDFLPTLAETASAGLPAGHPRDGRSFLPQVLGRKGAPRDWIFCDYNPRWGKMEPARWAMDHDWKLYGDGRFFDLRADPLEERPPMAEVTGDAARGKSKLAAALSKFSG
ncbi:MAG: sulfatase-like hydrolase/transferase [Bryobacterales bacterium]|nr:sulfatase-like hydrolase/transferase [Bryobacterales bacterium]